MVIYTPENLGSMLVFRGCMICEHKLNKTPWHIPQTTNPTMQGHRCTVQVTHAQCQPSQSRLFLRNWIGKKYAPRAIGAVLLFYFAGIHYNSPFLQNRTVKLLTFERNGFLGCIYSKRFVHSESTFVTPACGGWSSESQHLTGPSHCRGVSTPENEGMSTLKGDYFNRKMHLPTIDFHGWHVSFLGGCYLHRIYRESACWRRLDPFGSAVKKVSVPLHGRLFGVESSIFPYSASSRKSCENWTFCPSDFWKKFSRSFSQKVSPNMEQMDSFFSQPKQWTKLGLFHPEIRGVMGQT